MTCIGDFTKTAGGFEGQIKMMTINVRARMEPNAKRTNKAPDWRVFTGITGGAEVGAGWSKTSRAGREYISVKLDDPSFPAPVWARLVEVGKAGIYELIWQRPVARAEPDDNDPDDDIPY